MSEIILNQHYTSNPKAERSPRAVATAPGNLPSYSLCRDEDMNLRMRDLNNDIYQDSKREKSSKERKFLKWFGGLTAAIICIRWIRGIKS